MEAIRKPFQGVFNIIRFNWHFFVMAFGFVLFLLFICAFLEGSLRWAVYLLAFSISITTIISLLVSYYVYDLSGLYQLKPFVSDSSTKRMVNINAGFDETSKILQKKYQKAELIVLDFYDPKKHTEVSIKRARKAYPPFPGTKQIETNQIKLANQSINKIFLILSAHEIRKKEERIIFFKELNRILEREGKIYIVEHLRDLPNLLAYNIGFFHFHSKKMWKHTFEKSNFRIAEELKLTPFISTFILEKNGNTF